MTDLYVPDYTKVSTALHCGDPILVDHPDLPEPATASYVGHAGGPEAVVRLDGTNALLVVPRIWLRRPE